MSDKLSFRQAVLKYLDAIKDKKDDTVCLVWIRDKNAYENWTRKQLTKHQENLVSRTDHIVMWLTLEESESLLKQCNLRL